jgi:excisionase family DNA binding protein
MQDTKTPERGAFNPAEAAIWLGISRSQIYRLVRTGELRHRYCGTRILISRRALDEYLDGEQSAAKPTVTDRDRVHNHRTGGAGCLEQRSPNEAPPREEGAQASSPGAQS